MGWIALQTQREYQNGTDCSGGMENRESVTTPPISGDDVISNLLHNQMILTPIAIDAHGRVGPMTGQKFYGTPPPAIPPRKQFKPNRPNAKAMYDRATTLPAPIGIFIEADQ